MEMNHSYFTSAVNCRIPPKASMPLERGGKRCMVEQVKAVGLEVILWYASLSFCILSAVGGTQEFNRTHCCRLLRRDETY
ncbi:unnamed protein product [Victoria cruziana]